MILMQIGVLAFYVFFNVFHNFSILLLFSPDFLELKAAYTWIFLYALLKLSCAVALMPMYLGGQIKNLIFSEVICLSTVILVYKCLNSFSALSGITVSFSSLAAGFFVSFVFLLMCNFAQHKRASSLY